MTPGDQDRGRWKERPPPTGAWRGKPNLDRAARTAEQDRAAGGPDRRWVELGDGRRARASVELKVLPRTRRIRAYLRWSDKGTSPNRYLGEVTESTRRRNLEVAWRMARELGLIAEARDERSGSWAISLDTRAVMQANRGRDSKPELALRSALHRLGLRFRVDIAPVRGIRRRADIVFPRARVAVFSDGCFWHGCPEHYRAAQRNSQFWNQKIATNQARDRDTNERLAVAGWLVMRVWEHDDPIEAAKRIAVEVRDRPRH